MNGVYCKFKIGCIVDVMSYLSILMVEYPQPFILCDFDDMLFASNDLVFVFQVAEGVASVGVEDLVVDEGVVGVTEVDGVRTFI